MKSNKQSMTIEEAIRILHPDTTLDALAEIDYYAGFDGHKAMVKTCEEACIVACEVMSKKIKMECNCESCKNGIYMVNNVTYPQYRFCPKCGKKLEESGE